MTRYKLTHRTEYEYEQVVTPSYGMVHLLPRTLATQIVHRSELTVEPSAGDITERTDFFGNRTAFFTVHAPHRRLVVTATSDVEVLPIEPVLGGEGPPWEEVRDGLDRAAGDAALDARQFRLDSPRVHRSDALAAYARPSFPSSRPIVEALIDLTWRIHDDFTYDPDGTTVSTTVEEVLDLRAGVCQDFAHVAIGCLRALGLPARYVSGYLETRPPPGRPRLIGADASHAWASAFVPGVGWVDADPTNDRLVTERYITTGWGRDYGDVAPLRGIIYTKGRTKDLVVSVDVEPVA